MFLYIKDIEIYCIIGERPDERMRLQRLSVDVRLEIGDKVAVSDSLDDTVDYVAVADRIRQRLTEAKCKMVERAAAIAADAASSFQGGIGSATAMIKVESRKVQSRKV